MAEPAEPAGPKADRKPAAVCCGRGGAGARPEGARTVALVGQSNVGKSLVFFRLSGSYVSCSNYPGSTVELYEGRACIGGRDCVLLDTPGMLDLCSAREDERVTQDLVLFGGVDVIVQVADAKNLERALGLFVQLAELDIPLVLDLNMADEGRERGLGSTASELAEVLGVPVVETVATTGEGTEELRQAIAAARVPRLRVDYGARIEAALEAVGFLLPESPSPRALAALLLALPRARRDQLLGELGLGSRAATSIDSVAAATRERLPRLAYRMSLARRATAERLLHGIARRRRVTPFPTRRPAPQSAAASRGRSPRRRWAERLGRWSVHPLWGVLILGTVLYGLYEVVGVLGAQVMVDFLEETVFGTYLNPAAVKLADRYIAWALLRDLLVGEFGLVTMAVTYSVALILPIITTFFLAFGFLEDSGYFPRLTVVAHRMFRCMGLSGQAVLPMILGLSCDTMATVTTRVLETRKERVIATLLLALGVPCSAQLAVLLAMSAAVSPAVLGGVLAIVAAQILLVGWLASLLLPGRPSTFIMELPPLRWPQWRNIVAKTRLRLVWYATEVVPLFVLGTLALFGLHRTGALAAIQAGARPLVSGLLDLPAEASTAFVMGFFRRDYGAAGLYGLQRAGALEPTQVLVSLVVITLFVPCIANLLMIVRERGWKTAVAMVGFILPYAFLVGWVVNLVARSGPFSSLAATASSLGAAAAVLTGGAGP